MNKYRKSTFDNIPEEKRNRILDAAIREFAATGYRGTNISGIASRAGISTGSVYRYYDSKEDLYLDIIDEGYKLLETQLTSVFASEGDLVDKLERVLRSCIEFSKENPEMTQLYLESTTESMAHLSKEASMKVEGHSAKFYSALVRSAKANNTINSDVPDGVIAFFLDNVFMMLQFSFSSSYFKARMALYLDDPKETQEELLVSSMMKIITKALR